MRNTDRTDFRTVKQVSLIGVLFLQNNHPKEFDLTTEFLTRLILTCT